MIDVVMPVFMVDQGSFNLTEAALETIRKAPVRVIIVDDASPFGAGRLREWADLYIRSNKNEGFTTSVNKGLRLVDTDLVVIANNDIKVSSNWYDVTKNIMKNKKVGSLHFRMLPYDQPFNPGKDTWLTGKERWTHFSFLVTRKGRMMDGDFYNTFGDWDFVHRVREDGLYTAYTNKAEFQHLDTYTINQIPTMTTRNKENYELFKKRHGEYPDTMLAKKYPEQHAVEWKPFP